MDSQKIKKVRTLRKSKTKESHWGAFSRHENHTVQKSEPVFLTLLLPGTLMDATAVPCSPSKFSPEIYHVRF